MPFFYNLLIQHFPDLNAYDICSQEVLIEYKSRVNKSFIRLSTLQNMRRIDIRSGYRHPDFNTQVGGSSRSRHMSNEAVEISSPSLTPLEPAEITLNVMGGAIGIGPGSDFIGVDVHGSLATWVESGADMTGTQFRTWVDQTCQARAAPELAQKSVQVKTY